MKNKLISWILLRIYRLNLHFDLILVSRWKWRKYFAHDSLVLEIGPGGGPWTLELLKRNNRVTVADVDMASLLRLKNKLELFPLKRDQAHMVNCHAKNFSSQKKYDQIIIFEVLEHIMDDERALVNLVRHLAPGGEVLISTPSRDHRPIAGECVSPREDGRHVRKGYSFEDFANMLSRCGMKIIKKDTAARWFTRRLTAASNAVYRLTKNQTLTLFFRIVSRPLAKLDLFLPWYKPYCIFLIAVRDRSPE